MLTYQEALSFIHGRPRVHKEPTLSRMRQFLDLLGAPDQKLNCIHVAGTNGKGSTVAFLTNLLMESGLDVGSFTSPFITKFNERIRLNNQMVSDDTIISLVSELKPVVAKLDQEMSAGPTEFEIVTAMMFLYFSKHPVDVVVVEVGIGGRYDATNVITPAVSVITTIGFDHMKLLGNTLGKIAYQKAGIIKDHVPVVLGKLPAEATTVIVEQAQQLSAPVMEWQKTYQVTPRPINGWHEAFDYHDDGLNLKNVQTNLMGDFQIDNAAVAIAAFHQFMNQQNLSIDQSHILSAIAKTQWAGRFEKVNDSPLVIIDGAHNEPAFKELRKIIKKYFYNQEIYIILAILSDKQYQLMVNTLADLNNVHLILTEFTSPHNRQVADLQTLATSLRAKNQVQYVDQWPQALPMAIGQMSDEDVLMIAGSLYFISEVRKRFEV